MNLRREGKADVAKVLDFLLKNPDEAEIIGKLCNEEPCKSEIFSKEKAHSVMTCLNLSKSEYNVLGDFLISNGTNHFPSYYQIQKAKLDCYPKKEYVTIDEREAKIHLQAILDHSVSRVLETLPEKTIDLQNLTLISKWGCDGCSSQGIYKQSFSSETDQGFDDSSIFMTTIVPIKLFDTMKQTVIWENLRPSSTHFCRPIRFSICKETPEVIQKEIERIESEISSLMPTQANSSKVVHQLHMSMIDGKICNVITQTSSAMKCYICGATPKQMNNLKLIEQKIPCEEYYKFGISPLHAKIRFFLVVVP